MEACLDVFIIIFTKFINFYHLLDLTFTAGLVILRIVYLKIKRLVNRRSRLLLLVALRGQSLIQVYESNLIYQIIFDIIVPALIVIGKIIKETVDNMHALE